MLLSIVIPTRNRPFSLAYSVRSAVSVIEKLSGEVIIVSNGDSLEKDISQLDEELKSCCKIIRHPERLGLSQNWAFGFAESSGQWVTLLGDDDIIFYQDVSRLQRILEDTTEQGVKFRSGSFKWLLDGHFMEDSFSSPRVNQAIKRVTTPANLKDWWRLEPRKFPSGTGSSFIRRTWVKVLQDEGVMFAALSPDWFTSSMYVYSFESYLAVDEIWAYLGDHPASSIAQMKNPLGEIAQQEKKMNPYKPHPSLQLDEVRYPTTWLARMDSLLRAREFHKLPIFVPERELIVGALRTTPRYVLKVSHELKRQFPERKFFINVASVTSLGVSIFKSASLKVRLKFRVKPAKSTLPEND